MRRLSYWEGVHAEGGLRMLSRLKRVLPLLWGYPWGIQCWAENVSPGLCGHRTDRDGRTHAHTGTWLDLGWEQAVPAKMNPKWLGPVRCSLLSEGSCHGVRGGGRTETNLPCETLMVNKRRQRNMKEREREKCNCRRYIRNTWRTRKERINWGCRINREQLLYHQTFTPGLNVF